MNINEFKEIIEFAIGNENEASEFYEDVSNKVKNTQLKDMFMRFANDEKNHSKLLQNYLSKSPESFHFKKSVDYKFSESVDKPKLSLQMHPADAFALAMKNEEEAVQLYTELAGFSEDPMIQKTFHELAEMERGHKLKMEKAFKDITFSPDWGM